MAKFLMSHKNPPVPLASRREWRHTYLALFVEEGALGEVSDVRVMGATFYTRERDLEDIDVPSRFIIEVNGGYRLVGSR